ncbi:MAG TPA: hypothetical protein VN086_02960 [Candidatus Paceibacterota bacterium]|nr:hypothetical protein [Candidatus Paceibacterota bacterium]
MKFKTILLITLIAVWAVLNTGTYIYYVNGTGFDPKVLNPILTLTSLAFGSAVILTIGFARGFDRTAWRWNVGPFAIAILGSAFWQGMPLILGGILLLIATRVCTSLLREDSEPKNKWHFIAVNTALSGALMPYLGWWLEGTSEGPISFMLPFVPTVGAFALAYWGATRPYGYSLNDDLLGHRTKLRMS